MIKKAIKTSAMIGISAVTEGLPATARVETMISLECLYMADAIQLTNGPDSPRIGVLTIGCPRLSFRPQRHAFYKEGAGIQLAGKIRTDL